MKIKIIEIIKNWFESKFIYNIQIFLNLANFYQRFIQGFNKITVLQNSILKITRLSNKLTSNRNNSNKLVFSKNNGNKLVSRKNNSNNEVKFGDNSIKHAKKSEKLKS